MNFDELHEGLRSFKEARKGFLTARRMVPNVHARKLPAEKSGNIARDNMRDKHGRLGQLKNASKVRYMDITRLNIVW